MKEYKVVKAKLGWNDHEKKLEDLLNEEAVSGWIFKETSIVGHLFLVIFERDKHR